MRPTHVLVATSDGEKLTGETWMTLEDFVALFTYGTRWGVNKHGPTMTNEIRVAAPVEGGET